MREETSWAAAAVVRKDLTDEIFLSSKLAVLQMCETWSCMESVESRNTPRFFTQGFCSSFHHLFANLLLKTVTSLLLKPNRKVLFCDVYRSTRQCLLDKQTDMLLMRYMLIG